MNIHWFQHVPFEGLGSIARWAQRNDHRLIATRFWADDPLPDPQAVHMLIVMGGPMGVDDEARYPWLSSEKKLISEVIARGGIVLGICLGAQLLAAALGANVTRNTVKEIGWYPITRQENSDHPLISLFPEAFEVFHWHGDTFAIPEGGIHLQSSAGCRNQSFLVDDRLLGLQYHLEMTRESLEDIVNQCGDELVEGRWIQSELQIADGASALEQCNEIMDSIMDYLAGLIHS